MEGDLQQSSTVSGSLPHVPLFMTAAHELKAPLALVRQLSLSIEQGDLTSTEIMQAAKRITLTSERALRLTTDLTKTARLDDGLFVLEPINPTSLCQEVVSELTPLYAAQGRTIKVARRTRPVLGLANRDLLRRILLGFADNALHYGESSTPVVITTTVRNRGQFIRLGVRDYGPAIPANIWRILGTNKHDRFLPSRPESSKLGMYIACQFAKAMNARVGTLRHHDGATFYIDIGASTQLRLL